MIHDVEISPEATNQYDFMAVTTSKRPPTTCPCSPRVREVFGKPPELQPRLSGADSSSGEVVAGEWYLLHVRADSTSTGYFSCSSLTCHPPPETPRNLHPETAVRWTVVPHANNDWAQGTLLQANPGNWALCKAPHDVDAVVSFRVDAKNGTRSTTARIGPFRIVRRKRPALIIGVFGGLSSEYGGQAPDESGAVAPIIQLAEKVRRGLGESFETTVVPMYSDMLAGPVSIQYDPSSGMRVARQVADWIDGLVRARRPLGPVFMIGHSWGANAIAHAARLLAQVGVGVDDMLALDRTRVNMLIPRGKSREWANLGPDAGLDVLALTNWMAGYAEVSRDAFALLHGSYHPVACARVVQTGVLPIDNHGDVLYSRWAGTMAARSGRFWSVAGGINIVPINCGRPVANGGTMATMSVNKELNRLSYFDTSLFGEIGCTP
jgi:pimeloyl-ACP methyl ester carboxylesterase